MCKNYKKTSDITLLDIVRIKHRDTVYMMNNVMDEDYEPQLSVCWYCGHYIGYSHIEEKLLTMTEEEFLKHCVEKLREMTIIYGRMGEFEDMSKEIEEYVYKTILDISRGGMTSEKERELFCGYLNAFTYVLQLIDEEELESLQV